MSIYAASVQTSGFECTESLRSQLQSLEMKNAELLAELQHYEQVRLSPRESLDLQSRVSLLPPQPGDYLRCESPLLDDMPRLARTPSFDYCLPTQTPWQRKLVIANDSTYLETPLYKSGLLYKNTEISLNAKYSRQGTNCHLTIVYRTDVTLEDMRMEVGKEPENLKLTSKKLVFSEGKVTAEVQGLEMTQWECVGVFSESPTLVMSYFSRKEYKEIVLKLPISVASYVNAWTVSSEEMLQIYKNLSAHESFSQFPRYKSRISSKDILTGFLRYQGSFHLFWVSSDAYGLGRFMDGTEVVFVVAGHGSEWEVRCRCANLELREAVLQFLITLIAE